MLTKFNHISSAFLSSPQKASNMMVQLLAHYRGKTLETLLSSIPTKEFDSDDEYTWDVVGSTKRNIPLVEARNESGKKVELNDDNVGVGTQPFYLVFAEDWFAQGEVIFGNLNQIYPIRVLNEPNNPIVEGTNYVYRVELMGGISTGIPAERLLAGERFSVGFAPVSRELSRKAGDRLNSNVTLQLMAA